MQNEYGARQPGTTAEEWEGGFIPSHSSPGVVPGRERDVRLTPGSEPPPRFSIRLTPDQLWQLGECAYEQGLTMPELVRRLIRKELTRGQPEKAILAVQEQLGRKLTALERRVAGGFRGRGGRSGASAVTANIGSR